MQHIRERPWSSWSYRHEMEIAVGELAIVTGPPGSGKSTVCDLLAERFDSSVLVSGDWFFGLWRRGAVDPWLPEARAQANVAGNAAAATAGTFARSDCWVIYDGVVRPNEVAAFLTAAGLTAAHYVVILPPVTTCVERVASRGGHGFTSAGATRAMHKDFADAELPARHLITDTGAKPGDLTEIILSGLNDGGFLWKVAH
jgi:adenylate kinase family enzyme